MPGSKSQSFSQSYGSILSTSLTIFILLARVDLTWRPAAVMSTVCLEVTIFPSIFKVQMLRTRSLKKRVTFPEFYPFLLTIRFQGHHGSVKKKRELFLGQHLAFRSSLTLPYKPECNCSNFKLLPFHPWGQPWDGQEGSPTRLSPSNAFAIRFRTESHAV